MLRARPPWAVLAALATALVAVLWTPTASGTTPILVYPLPVQAPDAEVSPDLELTALRLINQERLSQGLVPLMAHATMRTAARAHAREMFAHGYLSHRSLDGRMPSDRIQVLGIHARGIGENLAYAADIREAHQALMASETHRQNILLPLFRYVGIGVAAAGTRGIVVVQNFSY